MDGLLTPGNVLVMAIVVVMLAVGGRRAVQGLTKGKSCCTDGAAPAHVPSARLAEGDADESRYPYRTELLIGGMSCENCARRVEGALAALPGTWARVDFEAHTALVRTKDPVDRAACEAAVRDAGYYVMKLYADSRGRSERSGRAPIVCGESDMMLPAAHRRPCEVPCTLNETGVPCRT